MGAHAVYEYAYEIGDYWWVPVALASLVILIVAVGVLHEVWKNRR